MVLWLRWFRLLFYDTRRKSMHILFAWQVCYTRFALVHIMSRKHVLKASKGNEFCDLSRMPGKLAVFCWKF